MSYSYAARLGGSATTLHTGALFLIDTDSLGGANGTTTTSIVDEIGPYTFTGGTFTIQTAPITGHKVLLADSLRMTCINSTISAPFNSDGSYSFVVRFQFTALNREDPFVTVCDSGGYGGSNYVDFISTFSPSNGFKSQKRQSAGSLNLAFLAQTRDITNFHTWGCSYAASSNVMSYFIDGAFVNTATYSPTGAAASTYDRVMLFGNKGYTKLIGGYNFAGATSDHAAWHAGCLAREL